MLMDPHPFQHPAGLHPQQEVTRLKARPRLNSFPAFHVEFNDNVRYILGKRKTPKEKFRLQKDSNLHYPKVKLISERTYRGCTNPNNFIFYSN